MSEGGAERAQWALLDDDEEFRAQVGAWARANVPVGWRERLRGAPEREFVALQRDWFGQLRAAGLLAPHLPSPWGPGFPLARQAIIAEQLARAGAPQLSINSVAIVHAAATLLGAGSARQRDRHLPAILDGEVWCQGFSEPNAGSDLSALQTRARWTDTGYVVNGQKIWSSYAQYADFCLLLARTDPDAPKRRGISFFILDLSTPGVEIRPIRQSTGESEFCEIFLTDVTIPLDGLIGEEHHGWQIAQQTLAAERGVHALEQIERLCVSRGRLASDVADRLAELDAARTGDAARQDLGQLSAETEILRMICHRLLRDGDDDRPPGPEAMLVKLLYSETLQRLDEAGVRWSGPEGQLARPLQLGASWETGDWMIDYVASWAWTIGGGTSEILRNIVAERVLGLPREPELKA
jgi:alkylation response protein AidB-like acyl-CoA dehydrogenase